MNDNLTYWIDRLAKRNEAVDTVWVKLYADDIDLTNEDKINLREYLTEMHVAANYLKQLNDQNNKKKFKLFNRRK